MERTIYDQCACCRRGTRTRWTVMLLFTMLLSSVTAWADTYNITFHLNGGTYEWNIDSYKDGDKYNLMTAERKDATFKGWYTTKTFEEGTQIAEVTGRTGDLEVWAKWECNPVTYIDENGQEQTTTEYIELNGSTASAKLNDSYNWYVVRGENVVYENQIACYGDLHIILTDGAKLTTQGTNALQSAGSIFIYGQSEGTGQLVATSQPAYGIYSQENITINGGTINATGGNFGISSFNGNVTINGGSVTAHGKDFFGILAPNVIINGGSVTATSDTNEGISVNSEGIVSIGGGSVNASYRGKVIVQPGKAFTTGTDNTIYCGTLTDDELAAINGKTLQPITWDGGNSAETAYVLTTPKHLELLAQCVNGGNDFSGKFFKLGGNITFDDATLTIDNDGDGTPESNHIAIGDETHAFAGTFDGQNYTISGLRITSANPRQGLFGSLGSTGMVKNVNLSDASIAGNDYTAGIVAYNLGTVANCQVDNTVALHCAQNDYDSFGGIVGYNAPKGIVSECTSSVTVTVADGVTAINHFGGVVGNNNSTVNGCLAVGVVIPDVNHHGAVVGLNQMDGTLTANYYTSCTVAGVENATNVGCNSSDVEGAKIIYKLTLGEGVSTSTVASATYNETNYYAQGVQVTLTATSDNQYGYTLTYGDGSSQAVDNSGIFVMPATDVIANIVPWDGEGTAASPYIITTTTQLDQLATNVNNGNDYSGKFFKLGADITYSTEGLAETESNYTPIGMYRNQIYSSFLGTFDGDGHTVSGIRIYHEGFQEGTTSSDENNSSLGLFGVLGEEGTVKNVTLADARITGLRFMGGIAGHNFGTITNCHVLNNVIIHTHQYSMAIGGVAGGNQSGTISGCTSSVTITIPDGVESAVYMLGGIVGLSGGTMRDCLAIGVTVPAADGYGAIYGDGNGSSNNIERNYYTGCTVAGVKNATGVGGYNDTCADRTGAAIGYTVTNASAEWMDINFGTPETTYGENGISLYATADDNVKLLAYDGVIYAPDGANVKFTTSLTNGLYALAGVKANDTELTADESGNYNFDVASQNYVISTDGHFYWGIDEGADGSEEHPYIITTTEELDLLSTLTNAGEDYAQKFFQLGADITYSYASLAEDGENYTPIGKVSVNNNTSFPFRGSFDGQEHTISGIRIYRNQTTGEHDAYLGIFGILGKGGVVKNVTVADTHITGFTLVGGVVGDNLGTVNNCHVLNSVVLQVGPFKATHFGGIVGTNAGNAIVEHSTSAAHIVIPANVTAVAAFGGIAGANTNDGVVEGCVSAVQFDVLSQSSDFSMFGGIAGMKVTTSCAMRNNLVIGASLPDVSYHGAIAGNCDNNNIENNYYTACTVAGTPMASGIGYGGKDTSSDLTANDGAVPALRDGADNSTAIELLAQVPEAFKPFKVSLAGRTLYKDGNWNTLCLPFNVDNFEGTPFKDATVKTLSSSEFSNGTLTLNFSDATAIAAGMPYIVKWDSGDNVENPVFENVTIKGDSNTPTATDAVTFQGLYSPLSITAEDNTMLYMGAGNTLYYPNGEMTIGAFRAYFRLANGITAGDLSSAQGAMIVLNFDGEETTGIENLNPAHASESEGSWFTLDGRRINGKPSQRGIYINNGKKVVIK